MSTLNLGLQLGSIGTAGGLECCSSFLGLYHLEAFKTLPGEFCFGCGWSPILVKKATTMLTLIKTMSHNL